MVFQAASITGGIGNGNVSVGINIPLGGGTKVCPRPGDNANQTVVCRNNSDPSCYSCCFGFINISGSPVNREECRGNDGSCFGCGADAVLCDNKKTPYDSKDRVCCPVRWVSGFLGIGGSWQGGCADFPSSQNCVFSDNGSYDGSTPTTTRTCLSS